jgi:C-terminal processing protease CtpA/Prc
MVSFKRLSPKTNLLTIRSFNESLRRSIDSIVTANDKLIQSTDNLIIDIRGNGGGSDISYYPLRKYLFTHPYLRYGASIYATNDNIQKFRDLATNPLFTPAEHERFRNMVSSMEQHLDKYWSPGTATFTSDTLPVLPYPKKIAVIIDSLCGSTAEQFLLDPVSNSKKATMYGTHTAGVLDYANITSFKIPNTNISVNYATSRSNRIDLGKGIDNTGIQPHIKLDNSIGDWLNYVWKDIEK